MDHPVDVNPYALDRETMRRMGYQVVDILVNPLLGTVDERLPGL